jgi:H+-transporting ATPase
VLRIGNYLIVLAVALVNAIVAVSLLRGDPLLTTVQFALVLSVTMAIGTRLLAARQAIVTRLVAIEELASVDVLCADKTGTLTQTALTPGDPFTVGDVAAADVTLTAALASRTDNDDPIDTAVFARCSTSSASRRASLPEADSDRAVARDLTRCTEVFSAAV